MIKYLYGKSHHLGRFAETGRGLWFRDLFTMDQLENDKISDNESRKSIQLPPDAITTVVIADREFPVVPNKPITVSLTPRRCHVLCLSDKGNNEELFELFEADICIAIDVIKLVGLIESENQRLGLKVLASSVTYYENETEVLDLSLEQLVFAKPVAYRKECEFRIAVFWPNDQKSNLLTETHGILNVFQDNATANDHIAFDFESPAYEEVVHSVTRT